MRKYRNQIRVLAGAVTMLLASQPLSLASLQAKQVKLSPEKIPAQSREKQARKQDSNKIFKPLLLAQTETPQNSEQEVLFPNPNITIDGNPATNNRSVPQFLPRAIAPPVGDIAISNINASASTIDLGTRAVVPRLVLREAPVREVLGLLARSAGLNLVFSEGTETTGGPAISLDLENQPVEEVFNSVLLISGLTANRRGGTIYVGSKLPDSARNLITRTLRLNQVQTENAAAFLASQGAKVERLIAPIREIVDPVTQRVVQRVREPAQLRSLSITGAQDTGAPLLLTGLKVSTDDRLNVITLVGEPRKVQIATSFITQLDARQRQVAVNVKVVDVDLDKTENYNSSFAFGVNDTYILQDNGRGAVRFGRAAPPTVDQFNNFRGRVTNPPDASIPNPPDTTFLFQYPRNFLAQLQASITNRDAKILSDPTLVAQEGQQATVKLAENVITSIESEVDPDSGVRTTTPVIDEVGLLLTIDIDRIDDNGFVTLAVAPTVSAPGQNVLFNSGITGEDSSNVINLVIKRELSSGLIRLRDGQTLILSGIIQESERTNVTKVPLLGDIPVIGALFRSSSDERTRAEVVVLVTPQILDDTGRSVFGYNYNPGKDARQMLQKRGFPVQGNQ